MIDWEAPITYISLLFIVVWVGIFIQDKRARHHNRKHPK